MEKQNNYYSLSLSLSLSLSIAISENLAKGERRAIGPMPRTYVSVSQHFSQQLSATSSHKYYNMVAKFMKNHCSIFLRYLQVDTSVTSRQLPHKFFTPVA